MTRETPRDAKDDVRAGVKRRWHKHTQTGRLEGDAQLDLSTSPHQRDTQTHTAHEGSGDGAASHDEARLPEYKRPRAHLPFCSSDLMVAYGKRIGPIRFFTWPMSQIAQIMRVVRKLQPRKKKP